ncbi:MAG: signal peptide peptidase SppA [Rhizobiaceae bacterium]
MTNADEIIDRRRLRRKLSFWRIAAFIILAIALLSMILFAAKDTLLSGTTKDHIARVKITGVITNDEPMISLLETLKDNKKVSAVILNISSPGGSTVGGEAIFEAVRNLADEKPVVTTIGTLAASAGYMVASGTDHIVARRSSIVGSIGVLFQYADASQLLDKIGVKVNAVKSSPLKAEPSPFSPASEEAIAMIDRVIQDSYNWFVDIVVDRRKMTRAKVLTLADGSIFTGSQGLENGLIDAIGGEDRAISWLETEKKVSTDLEVIEYKPKRPGDSLFDNPAAVQKIARYFGIEISNSDAIQLQEAVRNRLLLDGLVSIWQGSN